ncbi:hypothetical protein PTTG_11690 [Puccinia triticina 1-1 BBBD Race 1]|uniref:Secreted protein n=2 Tax=Puccinia triticina TaxID=208348 RepID=A0A180H0Y5_PUCT1|nr:uncharacterized protein PtA15_8A397 [Puccinia triticina]OAV98269.1 hypothetical protein PTTG_11690 [Puccinia triticina 1-1 BBBD Race 1]WAQ87493.1 hypothetical protein PtA15_8A397 [Puccinia triticina]WAR57353.1 hypothetical protein PtB15_8B400 [Puccinia triticina]
MMSIKLLLPLFMLIVLQSQAVYSVSRPAKCPNADHAQAICARLIYDNGSLVGFHAQKGEQIDDWFHCAYVAKNQQPRPNIINMCCSTDFKLPSASKIQLVPIGVENYGDNCFNAKSFC